MMIQETRQKKNKKKRKMYEKLKKFQKILHFGLGEFLFYVSTDYNTLLVI